MQVRVTPNVRQKYVLVRALYSGTETMLLWGNPNVQWHAEIVQEVKDAGYEVIEPFGGGWLYPNPEEGTVYVWGKSDRLGPAPFNLVREVLKGVVIEGEPG